MNSTANIPTIQINVAFPFHSPLLKAFTLIKLLRDMNFKCLMAQVKMTQIDWFKICKKLTTINHNK